MKRRKRCLGAVAIAAGLLAQTGCALLTTRRVAMFVGKQVYEEFEEDRQQNEKTEQAAQAEPAEQEPQS